MTNPTGMARARGRQKFLEVTALLLTLFLVCACQLALATALLLLLGKRTRVAHPLLGLFSCAALVVSSASLARVIWSSPLHLLRAAAALGLFTTWTTVVLRRRWNPFAQMFLGSYVAAAASYLVFAVDVTFVSGLSPLGMLASALLLFIETLALTLAGSFAFESLDVLCRSRWDRKIAEPDPDYQPLVCLQIAAYNEPPDMLIETIRSAEEIDYPNLQILVIDNNTTDPDVWQPVELYCRSRERVRFSHVRCDGFKSGALNFALDKRTDPEAELIGVVDADYLVDPAYLKSVVGYFADPNVAFVQTPQDYREYEGDAYLTSCYDAYRYFFLTSMPSRNERNSIIFAGTMGLLRRSALERVGGWNEWCITEDAEVSLRLLRDGYSGVYIPRSFGRGIMPLTFASLKSQRFRWCFGGMQIIRSHWRDLMPWNRDPRNHLSFAQRMDYLLGGLQWTNDLANLGFASVLVMTALVLLTRGWFALRPLVAAAGLLPLALIGSGLLRATWALRNQARISVKRTLLAFANWLSLSFTVAVACVLGLTKREGVFLRTPKQAERGSVSAALRAARPETALAFVLWGLGAALIATRHASALLGILFLWQGAVYASSPFMAWLNQHTELSAQLERRRRSEWMRERGSVRKPILLGFGSGVAVAGGVAALVLVGVLSSAPLNRNPFQVAAPPASSVPTPTASPAAVPSFSLSPSATVSTSVGPTTSVSPSSTPSSSPSASASPSASSSPSSSPSPSATTQASSTP